LKNLFHDDKRGSKNNGKESWWKFILEYPDRVLLGSDMLTSIDLHQAIKYVDHVCGLDLPNEVEKAVLSSNAHHFLAEDITNKDRLCE